MAESLKTIMDQLYCTMCAKGTDNPIDSIYSQWITLICPFVDIKIPPLTYLITNLFIDQ